MQQIAWGQELDLTELYELKNRMEVLDDRVNVMQDMINWQHHTINELREVILKCCDVTIADMRQQDSTLLGNKYLKSNNNNDTNSRQTQILSEIILYQNIPNPFSSNTEISCDIPAINNSAFIYIYNLQGVELMSFPIMQTGYNTVYVYASALPAGMYLYTLVVDNVIIDTKRMILTK